MNPVGPIVPELSGLAIRPADAELAFEEFAAALLAVSLPRQLPVSLPSGKPAPVATQNDTPVESTVVNDALPRPEPQASATLVSGKAAEQLPAQPLVTFESPQGISNHMQTEPLVELQTSLVDSVDSSHQRPVDRGHILQRHRRTDQPKNDVVPVGDHVESHLAADELSSGRTLSHELTQTLPRPAQVVPNDATVLAEPTLETMPQPLMTSTPAPPVPAGELIVSIPLELVRPRPVAQAEGVNPPPEARLIPTPAAPATPASGPEAPVVHNPSPAVAARDLMISTPLVSFESSELAYAPAADDARLTMLVGAREAHVRPGAVTEQLVTPTILSPERRASPKIPLLPERIEVRGQIGNEQGNSDEPTPLVPRARVTTAAVDRGAVHVPRAEQTQVRLETTESAESTQVSAPPLTSVLANRVGVQGEIETQIPTEISTPTRTADITDALDTKPRSEVMVRFTDQSGGEGRLRVAVRGSELRATLVTDDHATAERLGGDITEIRRTLQERGFHDPHLAVHAARRSAEGDGAVAARGWDERSAWSEHRREPSREQQREQEANQQHQERNRFSGSHKKGSNQ